MRNQIFSRLIPIIAAAILFLQPANLRAAGDTEEQITENARLAAGGANQIERLNEALAPFLGEWIKTDVSSGVSWGQVLLAAMLMLLLLVAERALNWALRRVAKKCDDGPPFAGDQPGKTPAGFARSTMEAAIPPLSALVWVWGVSGVLWILLIREDAATNPSLILMFLVALRKAATFLILFWLVYRLIKSAEILLVAWASSNERKWDDVVAAVVIRAMRLIIPLLAITLIVPMLNIPAAYHQFFKQGAALILIAAIGLILFQLADTAEKAVLTQYRIDIKDNLAMRKVQTQVQVLKRVAVILILIFTMASMLMVFDSVRQLGTSLLASAGVVGIVVGFAAQRSISSLLAGIQIAFTQPIRIDDQVNIENETGKIEEITLTYVVVNLWDSRRLIVPINYFIEKPFQNWTRTGSDLLGTVHLQVDYTTPIAPLRAEFERIVEKSPYWDKRVKVLHVTDARESTIEVRGLASATSSGAAWDLRCEIREKLIDFLQRNYPDCLPRVRIDLLKDKGTANEKPPEPEPVKMS